MTEPCTEPTPAPYGIEAADGRRLTAHDVRPVGAERLALVWHHGSPQTGAPLAPLAAAAGQRGVRLISYARPGYGGSTPDPGRDVAAAAADKAAITAALGIERFAVMGASGGGPHALACAAQFGARVSGAVVLASPAPFTPDSGWYDGMIDPGGLRAAQGGRAARAQYALTETFDERSSSPPIGPRWRATGLRLPMTPARRRPPAPTG